MKKKLKVLLANPRGFCAGVVRAIDVVNRSLEKYGPPIYVRHEIVHNKYVVESLRKKGAKFVTELDEVPEGAITIFSAHGVAKKVFGQEKIYMIYIKLLIRHGVGIKKFFKKQKNTV